MLGVTRFERDPWSIFGELESLQDDLNRVFAGGALRRRPTRTRVYPPMNMWLSPDGVIVDAELPGVDPAKVDVSVTGDELTVSGTVGSEPLAKGETEHRRERWCGQFSRKVRLPFRANSEGVKAHYSNGILRLTVPRSEEDKPRRIAIEAA